MFWSAGQLYDLKFKENTGTVPVLQPDVRTFEVTDAKTGERHRPVLPRHLCPRGQALGRVGDRLPQPRGPARRRRRAGVEQQ